MGSHRIGFVGELGYEIYLHDATKNGTRLWNTVLEAGRPHRLRPRPHPPPREQLFPNRATIVKHPNLPTPSRAARSSCTSGLAKTPDPCRRLLGDGLSIA